MISRREGRDAIFHLIDMTHASADTDILMLLHADDAAISMLYYLIR